MPRSKSSFRKGSTQSKMRFSVCAAWRSNSRLSRRSGPCAGHGSLPSDAWRLVSRRSDLCAEIGDLRRFDTPRQRISFLGLVPAESSTGDTIRRKGLTLAGNRRARRALIEAAWTYRYPARVSETLRARRERLPKPVRDIAWKAQVRLCARCRRLSAMGKEAACRRGRDRPRDRRFPVGDRARGRASVRGGDLSPGTKGRELPSLVMWLGCRPTPVL
jgi:hypothetical protein